MVLQRRMHQEPNRLHASTVPLGLLRDRLPGLHRGSNRQRTWLGHAMVRARLRLRMKAARIPNRPAKLDTSKLKTAALEHLRLDLRNRFEGLQLDELAMSDIDFRAQRKPGFQILIF